MLSQCEKAYKRYGTKTISLVIKMVSWGFAFKKGAIIWLWSIVWSILGGIIAIAISGGSLFVFFTNPTTTTLAASMLGILGGILIGSLVTTIFMYATIVKITMESTLEED